jgi:hypothetical protein
MDESLSRLAEVPDLEPAAVLLACDQDVCMPPAGVVVHGERLEAAQPRDDIEVDAVRVAPPRLREGPSRPRRAHRLDRAHGRRRAGGAARGAPALVGQLGDPSAQVSGALAGRAVVGVPADAAAVAHREGVLPGRKKRPEFLSELVQVVHGLSHLSVARVAASAPRLSY